MFTRTLFFVGIDLQLCPITCLSNDNGTAWGYSHTVLDLPRWGELFVELRELESMRVTGRVSLYQARLVPDGCCKGERLYGEIDLVKGDSYGDPWVYWRAGDVARVLSKFVGQSTRDRMCGGGFDQVSIRPVLAFVQALDPAWLVIPRWH